MVTHKRAVHQNIDISSMSSPNISPPKRVTDGLENVSQIAENSMLLDQSRDE